MAMAWQTALAADEARHHFQTGPVYYLPNPYEPRGYHQPTNHTAVSVKKNQFRKQANITLPCAHLYQALAVVKPLLSRQGRHHRKLKVTPRLPSTSTKGNSSESLNESNSAKHKH
jgi:hypothetical protein